ncbi:hypothetical protein T261_0171 [Streptomyces lydicus]|nr:hypothetical protein T261_0171 [Streptomyces lydicus]
MARGSCVLGCGPVRSDLVRAADLAVLPPEALRACVSDDGIAEV